MTQKELINQIKEARKEFLDKNPCKHCVGSGCNDCRDCEDASLRYELSLKVFKLKEEFEKLYNIEYDDYINNQKPQSQYSLNKELLLKDLCSRLPYKVKVRIPDKHGGHTTVIESIDIDGYITDSEGECLEIEKVKLYLFPLSSMNEEQRKEFELISDLSYASTYGEEIVYSIKIIDFFNKNHFDYRGLIEKGLALDATGLNIY